MHQGNSCNTVVGCWLSNRHIMMLSGHRNKNSIPSMPTMLDHRRSSFRCAVMFSHLSLVHNPHKPISKCKSSVGSSSNLNNLDPLIVPWFQTSKTSLTMSDSTSQPSSRAAKSGKFALLSKAKNKSDIHLEVLYLQSRQSFHPFFCFHRTLGICPKDLEGFKADIAFIYTALA